MTKQPVNAVTRDGEQDIEAQHGRILNEVVDESIGARGTPQREEYEALLQRKLISAKLREFRRLHNLSQAELGDKLGVLRNQVCKLERDASNITLSTLFKMFNALDIEVTISFKPKRKLPKK